MCGPSRAPRHRFKVILEGDETGEEHFFLTSTEARMYAMANGGGRIEQVE